jgi:prolyl-tRNA editing enzyme YbaK/EbsC (Cys-tRNA(Pro) deacylase)
MIIPGSRALDLKRLAQALGIKQLRLATSREAEELTGLQMGGLLAMALLESRLSGLCGVGGPEAHGVCRERGTTAND